MFKAQIQELLSPLMITEINIIHLETPKIAACYFFFTNLNNSPKLSINLQFFSNS